MNFHFIFTELFTEVDKDKDITLTNDKTSPQGQSLDQRTWRFLALLLELPWPSFFVSSFFALICLLLLFKVFGLGPLLLDIVSYLVVQNVSDQFSRTAAMHQGVLDKDRLSFEAFTLFWELGNCSGWGRVLVIWNQVQLNDRSQWMWVVHLILKNYFADP